MAKYATNQSFDGQQASVGKTVLLAAPKHDGEGMCLRAGMVMAISSGTDRPWLVSVGHPEEEPSLAYTFVPTKTAEDAEALPIGSWTWPPRL